MSNRVEKLTVIPTGGALGAEVRGVDFNLPVDAEVAAALNRAWAEHQVLLFRGQDISPKDHVAASALFGVPRLCFQRASRTTFQYGSSAVVFRTRDSSRCFLGVLSLNLLFADGGGLPVSRVPHGGTCL